MPDNRFTVFNEGDELYQDMIEGICNAGVSIDMESYIFEADATGLTFIEALVDRARSGLSIRLHLDAFGSLSLSLGRENRRMAEAGIEIRWFNPWHWYTPLKFNRRNHRKLLVIDGSAAWLGGFNIHRENSSREYGESRWRDTHVRIEGPLAQQAKVYFDRFWEGQRRWRPVIDIDAESALVSNHNWSQRRQLRRLLAQQFFRAKNCIWLCTPYFMPDHFLQRHMVKAARRGVDVSLLLPYKTDRPVAQWAARAAYASLMASGIRIFEYQPRVLHGKIIIIDNNWCSVGSANLDYRSLYVNFEINLVSHCSDLVNRLQNDFINDLTVSREIDSRKWARQSLLQRVYQSIGWICRRFL